MKKLPDNLKGLFPFSVLLPGALKKETIYIVLPCLGSSCLSASGISISETSHERSKEEA